MISHYSYFLCALPTVVHHTVAITSHKSQYYSKFVDLYVLQCLWFPNKAENVLYMEDNLKVTMPQPVGLLH